MGLPTVVGQALPIVNQTWSVFRSPPSPVPVLNQTEALPAVVGLSSSEGESSSSGGRGSVFGSPPLPVPVLLPPMAQDVPPALVNPLAVSG
jgi:hypothetical protein